ncbi:MAG: hypothetical protein RL689_1045 [Planctomycetota bacterium]
MQSSAMSILIAALLAASARFASGAALQPADPPSPPVVIMEGGDEIKAFPAPEVSPAVKALLEAPYLSDAERASARVRHGVWTEADLAQPVLRARAAVIRGDWLDAALADPAADPIDRAEAMVRAGRMTEAIDALAGVEGLRAARVRAEAMLDGGRIPEGVEVLERAVGIVTGETPPRDGDELAEGVRCAMLLSRWKPGSAPSHQRMLELLGKARDELDRVSWRANLVEALLLYEKDWFEEVSKTVETVLTLNPSCAEAYWLYGQMCVDTFDFPRAERIAARLDALSAPSPSIHAACIRSYVRQRQNEGEAALAQLEGAFAAYPASRLLLGHQAASVATQFDFERVDRLLESYLATAPGSPLAHFLVGRAMSGSRQYAQAATYLAKAAEMAPSWTEPTVELGLSEMQAGRDQAALVALERAVKLDPLHKRAANSLTLLRELAGFVSVTSDHFVVRCKPGIDELVAREMLGPLEEIFRRVTGDGPGGIDHVPAGRTVVELYPNHRWFGVRITGMPALHTIAAATGPVIAMEAPREGPGHMGSFDWRRVVQHEYTHTVTLSRTSNRLPHWFTEASAVYLEDSPRDYSTVRLMTMAFETDRLFDLDTINIMFVRPKRPTDRSQAYAQGHLMYEYIIERFGASSPLRLMDLYAKGVRESAAFKDVLGLDRPEFLEGFKQWLKGRLEQWGMVPTQAAPGLKTLLERDAKAAGVEVDETGATPAQIEAWLEEFPANPFVLEEAVTLGLKASGGKAVPDLLPLLERYAAARPVDPMPHKLLASHYLESAAPEQAVPHLEYLDAREQHSPGFAAELARRHAAAGDMTRAVEKATRATQIAPYDPAYRELAATIGLRAGDRAMAERHIRALTVLEPDREIHKRRLEAISKLPPQ